MILTVVSSLLTILFSLMFLTFVAVGTIFYDIIGPAATGTGTARAQIDASYRVPSAARELLGVYLQIENEAPSAAEPFIAVLDIKGTDFRYQPCEMLFPVGNGTLAEVTGVQKSPSEYWPIHAPLNGTEVLDVGVEPCEAMAGNGQVGVTVAYSTVRTGKPVIYGKFSREVASGTTAGTFNTLTALTVSNARQMYEVVGTHVQVTTKADEEEMNYMTLNCTQWHPIQTIKFMLEASGTAGGAAITSFGAKNIRLPFDALFKASQATIEGTGYNYDVMTTAGVYVYGIRYHGTPR